MEKRNYIFSFDEEKCTVGKQKGTLKTFKIEEELDNGQKVCVHTDIHNDDYFRTEHNGIKANHRDLLEHLKDKDRQYYYDNILVPMRGKTLKDFLDGG